MNYNFAGGQREPHAGTEWNWTHETKIQENQSKTRTMKTMPQEPREKSDPGENQRNTRTRKIMMKTKRTRKSPTESL